MNLGTEARLSTWRLVESKAATLIATRALREMQVKRLHQVYASMQRMYDAHGQQESLPMTSTLEGPTQSPISPQFMLVDLALLVDRLLVLNALRVRSFRSERSLAGSRGR